MNILEKKIGSIKPVYLKEYEEFIKRHSQFGGGAQDDKYTKGKTFSNVYELYIYAFFLGLKNSVSVDIMPDDAVKGFWELENWKPKDLVNYLVMSALAESKFDMVSIEFDDESEVKNQINELKLTIEKFANGGIKLLKEELHAEPDLIDDDLFFINKLSVK